VIKPGERDNNSSLANYVELTRPDIKPYQGGDTSVPYVTIFDRGVTELYAVIYARTPGTEISGATATNHQSQNNIPNP
jgi:hypothetical protein